jgi:hypothetical protein
MAKEKLSFKPKEVLKKPLTALPDRARDVLMKRYGLDKDGKRQTLESIGKSYGITRERVRQIENFALNLIKKSEGFSKLDPYFNELKKVMDSHGGVVHEEEFLNAVGRDRLTQNYIHFMLVISDAFTKLREDDQFHHRWTTDVELAGKVHESIQNLCENFNEADLISETDLVQNFIAELSNVIKDPRIKEFAPRWITLTKNLNRNPLGEWGLSKSPNVKMRGIRDYAFLVLRQHGSPMHFTEVAKLITKHFGKNAHPATCHNELIKDSRFVLVGRGLYALTEWGYSRGIVRDVISNILKREGPLTKDDVINRVLKERHVKENTIVVNLQNPSYFKKDKQGRYMVI